VASNGVANSVVGAVWWRVGKLGGGGLCVGRCVVRLSGVKCVMAGCMVAAVWWQAVW
jgi:hypothetical protein